MQGLQSQTILPEIEILLNNKTILKGSKNFKNF